MTPRVASLVFAGLLLLGFCFMAMSVYLAFRGIR